MRFEELKLGIQVVDAIETIIDAVNKIDKNGSANLAGLIAHDIGVRRAQRLKNDTGVSTYSGEIENSWVMFFEQLHEDIANRDE